MNTDPRIFPKLENTISNIQFSNEKRFVKSDGTPTTTLSGTLPSLSGKPSQRRQALNTVASPNPSSIAKAQIPSMAVWRLMLTKASS